VCRRTRGRPPRDPDGGAANRCARGRSRNRLRTVLRCRDRSEAAAGCRRRAGRDAPRGRIDRTDRSLQSSGSGPSRCARLRVGHLARSTRSGPLGERVLAHTIRRAAADTGRLPTAFTAQARLAPVRAKIQLRFLGCLQCVAPRSWGNLILRASGRPRKRQSATYGVPRLHTTDRVREADAAATTLVATGHD
jgi:hypothetical protein